MEELLDDEGIDLETLQAQIDLTLANTKTLVSSWLNPGHGDSLPLKRDDNEREIQELLKRPARLGVGAPIPASTGTLGHETVKLKGKLLGKKRGREADEDIAVTQPSDDEEESRARAIKKKARIDPFAGKGKKNKQPQLIPAEAPSIPAVEIGVRSKTPETQKPQIAESSPEKGVIADSGPASPSKKRKKQKKLKQSADDATATPSPMQATSNLPSVDAPHTPSPVGKRASDDHGTPDLFTNSQTPVVGRSPSQLNGMPLLNLDGPPPVVESSPSKKKRKRNKRKKKKGAQSTEPQPEAQAESDDEAEV